MFRRNRREEKDLSPVARQSDAHPAQTPSARTVKFCFATVPDHLLRRSFPIVVWMRIRKGNREMVQLLVLGLFVAAVALWWRHAARQKRHRAVSASIAGRGTRSRFHCVEVRTGVPACEAARRLANVRFLSDHAPGLPVAGCTGQICTCSYLHHEDRREDDRRHPYGQWSNVPPALVGERRSRTDRRKSQETTFRPSIAR